MKLPFLMLQRTRAATMAARGPKARLGVCLVALVKAAMGAAATQSKRKQTMTNENTRTDDGDKAVRDRRPSLIA